jgi:hypothetical protein
VTERKDDAAEPNSEANPSHAAAASNIGAEPAPVYMCMELISGANTAKFTIVDLLPIHSLLSEAVDVQPHWLRTVFASSNRERLFRFANLDAATLRGRRIARHDQN